MTGLYPSSDMGSAAAFGWPSWPSQPVRVPVGPGGCPVGAVVAMDRYGPICAGVGRGPLFYPEANAWFQPGPTRWGPPDVWCPRQRPVFNPRWALAQVTR